METRDEERERDRDASIALDDVRCAEDLSDMLSALIMTAG